MFRRESWWLLNINFPLHFMAIDKEFHKNQLLWKTDHRSSCFCVVLCGTGFCRLSDDGQLRIAQRIDVDHTARSWPVVHSVLSGTMLEILHWSAAAAGNRFHPGMVRATHDPWSCAVTAPMAQNLKLWFAFVRLSAATIPSSSADTAVLLWVILYIRLSLLSLRLASKFFHPTVFLKLL